MSELVNNLWEVESFLSFLKGAPLVTYASLPQARECDHDIQVIKSIGYKVYRGEDL